MMLFWGEGFLRGFMRFIFLAAIALFCWGWVSNVALGRMTTWQYINKLCADFQQGIKTEVEKCRKTGDRIINNVQAWGRPVF
jgi:hypothetical protein